MVNGRNLLFNYQLAESRVSGLEVEIFTTFIFLI